MAVTGLRGRIVALTVVIATAVVAVLIVASHTLLNRVIDTDAHNLARTRAEAIAADIAVRDGHVELIENGSEAMDTVAWVYADGELIDGIVPDSVLEPIRTLAGSGRTRTARVDNSLLYAEPIPTRGHAVAVVVRVDLTPYETSEQHILALSLMLGGITVLLAGVIAFLVVRRAMRVVHDMAALADDWSDHQPGRRFGLGPPRDEFGELGRTLDNLLERVDTALADERRLTDEIAHELRTPLTVLRGAAQLAQLDGDRLAPETVLVEVERLAAAITTILRAARSRMAAGTRCDLRSAACQAVGARSVEVAIPGDLDVAVSGEVVVAMLSPLLDNGLHHALSRVWITARAQPHGVVMDVLDDGPGFDPSDVERVFEARVTGGTGGTGSTGSTEHGLRLGLGLAVVKRIAAAAGVEVRAVADGSGHIEVTLPAARAAG